MADLVERAETLTEAMDRLANTKRRLCEDVMLQVAHVGQLHRRTRGWGVGQTDGPIQESGQGLLVVGRVERNIELVRLAADSRRKAPRRQRGAILVACNVGIYIGPSGWEKIEIGTTANGALPVCGLHRDDPIKGGFDILRIAELDQDFW